MKTLRYWLYATLVSSALFVLSACDDDPEPENESELITTVKLTFSKAGNDDIVAEWQDLDGAGGNNPVLTPATIELSANTNYTVAVEILNESESPAEDITEEIEEEDEEHQLFFVKSASLNLTTTYSDTDDNGRPVGLSNVFTTGAASTGTLTVILRHEPDKSATGVSSGDPTNAGGETDIETVPAFSVSVQ
jgi:hypothetical protein